MIDLVPQEIMLLIQLCSKVCVIDPNKILFDTPMEMVQFVSAKDLVVPILARLDNDYPSLVPMPHDGVPWKDRVKK